MSRDGGFGIGDRSTRTLYDVRLVRATRKVGLGAIVAWDAIVDASWAAGDRVTFDDAVDTLPYDLGDTAPIRAALEAVCLLDSDGLIRPESWASWFGVADDRREAKRERDRAYIARRRLANESAPIANESQAVVPSYRTDPSVPSGPTDRTVSPPRERAPSKDGDTTFKTAMAAAGFHPAPKPVRAKR
jgi:hypothetical protein